jgi:anti-sigma B factor antagonist
MPHIRRHRLDVHTERRDGRCVVSPDGELDLFTVAELTNALRAGERGARTLVLDLSKLRFLDSAGIAALLAQHRRAQQEGLAFSVANPRDDVRRVLELSGLQSVLAVS